MTIDERLAAIRRAMAAQGLDILVGVHDGAHFIEKPNPVMVLAGFKALGAAAAILDRDGALDLVVTPEWDAERAAASCRNARVTGAPDLVEGLAAALTRHGKAAIGVAGLAAMPYGVARGLAAVLPQAKDADDALGAAATKTDAEIAHAREAVRIAELGYARLLEIARPGMSEDELVVELTWHMKSLGAEDNFFLLCAGAHNRAVQPSTGRRLAAGDIILAEITPSVRGQLAQICRTIVVGKPSAELADKYALVVRSMEAGIAAAVPGATMADVCGAINAVLEAQGYGEYCHPPHIRRRGHGLGFASNRPGDVALDNPTVLTPGMVFMIHPNQYLPETGYLLCGEPVLMTPREAQPLTRQIAALAAVAA
jgi:Xaa-Pro aminopeptidase